MLHLRKTHKSIFSRETSCGRFFESPPPYRETSVPKIPKNRFFSTWVGRIDLSHDMVSIFGDPRRATGSTRIGLFLIPSKTCQARDNNKIINCEKSIGVRETSKGKTPSLKRPNDVSPEKNRFVIFPYFQ